jgi:hypothetical protein
MNLGHRSERTRVRHAWWWIVCLGWLAVTSRSVAEAPPSRYDESTAGTIYDTRTRLTWQRDVDVHTFSFADAANYCAALELAGGGWNVPTRAELLTIIDPTEVSPAIDARAFPQTPGTWFWTSTVYIDLTASGWAVSFEDGTTDYFGTKRGYRVRCVR